MNIGIDGRAAKWYRGTGIGTYTYQLISNINNIDNINEYLLFLPQNTGLELNNNFSIKPIEESTNSNFWDEVNAPNILNNTDIDLYHVPQNGVGLTENINCLKTITLHDIIPLRMPETVSDRYLNIFNNQLPKIIENCDGIITVSEFSKDDIAREFNFPKDKIFVTYLGAEDIYKPLDKKSCKNFLKNKYNIDKIEDRYIIKFNEIIIGIVNDIRNKVTKDIISAKFHNTVVEFTIDMAKRMREKTKVNKVILTGGVFQNEILLDRTIVKLIENNFEVITHTIIPCNDSGISLGQLAIANEKIN